MLENEGDRRQVQRQATWKFFKSIAQSVLFTLCSSISYNAECRAGEEVLRKHLLAGDWMEE